MAEAKECRKRRKLASSYWDVAPDSADEDAVEKHALSSDSENESKRNVLRRLCRGDEQTEQKQSEKEWSCVRCTFLNRSTDAKCQMCLSTARNFHPIKTRATKKNTSNMHDTGNPLVSFTCSVCTFENSFTKDSKKHVCEMCNAPYPSASTHKIQSTLGHKFFTPVVGANSLHDSIYDSDDVSSDSSTNLSDSSTNVLKLPCSSQAKIKTPSITSHNLVFTDSTPIRYDDLCVHPKKKEEVYNWILKSSNSRICPENPNILILSGPPGIGKSTMIRSICLKLDICIKEWDDITGINDRKTSFNFTNSSYNNESQSYTNRPLHYHNQLGDFEHFLSRSIQYPTLRLNSNNKINNNTDPHRKEIVLIEEWPLLLKSNDSYHRFHWILQNTLLRNSKGRKKNLNCHTPVVIIFSDVKDSKVNINKLKLVFSEELVTSAFTKLLHCNPVASGILKKQLLKIAKREYKLVLNDEDLSYIVLESKGDFRYALNMLRFASFSTDSSFNFQEDLPDSLFNACSPKRKKDLFFSDFHVIGKLLHQKNGEGREKGLSNSGVLNVLDSDYLLCTLHENFVPFFSEIEDIYSSLENMSLCENLIQSKYKANSLINNSGGMAFPDNIVQFILGQTVFVTNEHPSKAAFRPIVGSKVYSSKRKEREEKSNIGKSLQGNQLFYTTKSMILDYMPYKKILDVYQQSPAQDSLQQNITNTVSEYRRDGVPMLVTDDEIEDSE